MNSIHKILSSKPQHFFWEAFARIATPLASPCERKFRQKFGVLPLTRQPVFIIGAPRTGSTILYQALTNYFDVLYIDNLACHWHKSIFLGLWLSNKIYQGRPHNNFSSEYGDTSQYGGHAPSECGKFWYQWLPRDHHFIDDSEITESTVNQITCQISAISNYFKRPLIFKNLNTGQRLRLIKKCFPEARLIFIRRSHKQVLQSINDARKCKGVNEGQWWSVMPADYRELLKLPESEMIQHQIKSVESQIKHDLALFPMENSRIVKYDDLSPALIIELGEWLGLKRRPGASMPKFKINT